MGKTTLTTNLAFAAAQAGATVLVVDADPQGNASEALGFHRDPDSPGLFEAVTGVDLADCVRPARPEWGSIFYLAGDEKLETLSSSELGWEHQFSELLPEFESFDLVLFDCPPNLGTLTLNALVAADGLLVATEAGLYSLKGVRRTIEVARRIEKIDGRGDMLAGILFNAVPTRRVECESRIEQARKEWGNKVWDPRIPHAAAVHEAVGETLPVAAMPGPRAQEIVEIYNHHAAALTGWLAA